MVTVASRVHRILNRLDTFRPGDSPVALALTGKLSLHTGEDLLGVYENQPQNEENSVAVSSEAIYVFREEGWLRLPYREIVEVELPSRDQKRTLSALTVKLNSSATVVVPVEGGSDQFRDAWQFLRFLQRVVRDQQNEMLRS